MKTNESVCTRSQNLYVSQQRSTGLLCDLAIIATMEEPTRPRKNLWGGELAACEVRWRRMHEWDTEARSVMLTGMKQGTR